MEVEEVGVRISEPHLPRSTGRLHFSNACPRCCSCCLALQRLLPGHTRQRILRVLSEPSGRPHIVLRMPPFTRPALLKTQQQDDGEQCPREDGDGPWNLVLDYHQARTKSVGKVYNLV